MIELSVLPETIKPAIGYVIVEVPYLTKDSKDNFDLQLLSDIAIGDYTVRSGIVYSCGTTDVPHFNFSHESPLQVEKGDRVWWMPNAVQQIANSRDEQYRVLKHGNRLFLSIPYKMLVMRENASGYAGINDYVISTLSDGDGLRHKVIHAPLLGVTYRDMGWGSQDTAVEVEAGMEVVLRKPRKMFLEHEFDMEFEDRLCVFQSRMILSGSKQ